MSSWLSHSYRRPDIRRVAHVDLSPNINHIYHKLKGLTDAEVEIINTRDLKDINRVRTYDNTDSITIIDKSEVYYDTTIRMFNAALIVNDGSYIIKDNSDEAYLLYRECPFSYDMNAAILCKIDVNNASLTDFSDVFEYTALGNNEDIRLFTFRNETYMSYTHNMNMKISKFNLETCEVEDISISFDEFPKEKNWTFFENNGVLYGIRYYSPLMIYTIDLEEGNIRPYCTYEWKFECPCAAIQLRGGAPPILLNGKYYLFLHSSTTYYIYAMTFDPVTFRPLTYTREPLFNEHQTYVKFTCGALFDQRSNEWVVAVGFDDLYCSIAKIGFDKLEERMVPI